eukprot:10800235-Heterocapsa_arctica.AAC.1
MYKTPRIVQVLKSNTQPIEANRGILAGCAFAVRYLNAMIKQHVTYENNELRYDVDDIVLFEECDTEEAIRGLFKGLTEAKQKLTDIGQVLNDKKEHISVQSKTGYTLASDQSRLQGKSRTSGYLSRNHSQNAYASQSQQSQKSRLHCQSGQGYSVTRIICERRRQYHQDRRTE